MRRRDLLIALAATPAALLFPASSRASGVCRYCGDEDDHDECGGLPEAPVAVSTTPLMEAVRRGEEGRLIMHAVPRTEIGIREVTFSVYEGEPEDPGALLVGPERRIPVEIGRSPLRGAAPSGEYHAVFWVSPEVRWRIVTEDGRVTFTDHWFCVTRGLTRLPVLYR